MNVSQVTGGGEQVCCGEREGHPGAEVEGRESGWKAGVRLEGRQGRCLKTLECPFEEYEFHFY